MTAQVTTDTTVPSRDLAVGYMERTRNYYRALGYKRDYTWAQNSDIPFCEPRKPLKDMRIAVVTTSSPAGTTGFTTAPW